MYKKDDENSFHLDVLMEPSRFDVHDIISPVGGRTEEAKGGKGGEGGGISSNFNVSSKIKSVFALVIMK